MNAADWILLVLVLGGTVLALRSLRRGKGCGCSSCTGCGGCGSCSACGRSAQSGEKRIAPPASSGYGGADRP